MNKFSHYHVSNDPNENETRLKIEELDNNLTLSGWRKDVDCDNYFTEKNDEMVDQLHEDDPIDRRIIYEITNKELNIDD